MLKPTPLKRLLFFIFGDIVISFFTLYLAYELRFNFYVPIEFYSSFLKIFSVLVVLKIISFYFMRIYSIAWRFFSLYEIKRLIVAHLIAYTVLITMFLLFREYFIPFARSIIIIDLFLSILFITLLRMLKRIVTEGHEDIKYANTVIIGIDSSIKSLLSETLKYTPVAIVDDDKNLKNTYISHLKVYPFSELTGVIEQKSIKAAIITQKYPQNRLLEIFEILKDNGIDDLKLYNNITESKKLQDITIEDLLARRAKDLDKTQIKSFIAAKSVLITGAGGSIGSEIARACKNYGAREIILVDSSEFNLYSIYEELGTSGTVAVMQNILNSELLEKTFIKYRPQIVIHAAAYKHVPLVEQNIHEAILNNIIGTKNVMDLSISYDAEKFVLISTDKAVRPTNVMGATKRVCELYVQNVEPKNTQIVAVRFGNVLGSSGSVIPKFKSQIEDGKNITVTHPEITRYFMLIPEACELVLQAASIGSGGEIFILDMGEPVKIVDLAKKMIELSGRDDIGIEFCGLRAGEKLYEELLIDESKAKTEYDSITVAAKTEYGIDRLNRDIDELVKCDNKIEKLGEIVIEFNHNGSSL